MNDILKKALADAEWYVSQFPSTRENPRAAQADNEMTIANLTMCQVMSKAGIDDETIGVVRRLWISASVTGENAAMETILAKHYATQH